MCWMRRSTPHQAVACSHTTPEPPDMVRPPRFDLASTQSYWLSQSDPHHPFGPPVRSKRPSSCPGHKRKCERNQCFGAAAVQEEHGGRRDEMKAWLAGVPTLACKSSTIRDSSILTSSTFPTPSSSRVLAHARRARSQPLRHARFRTASHHLLVGHGHTNAPSPDPLRLASAPHGPSAVMGGMRVRARACMCPGGCAWPLSFPSQDPPWAHLEYRRNRLHLHTFICRRTP